MANLREIQKEETNRRIVKAALEVFARCGYSGARIEDIAKKASVTKGLVSQRFDGKESLFIAVMLDLTAAYVPIESKASLIDTLLNIVRSIKDGAEQNSPSFLFLRMTSFGVDTPAIVNIKVREYFRQTTLCRQMEEASRRGELPVRDAFQLYTLFIVSSIGITVSRLTAHLPLAPDENYLELIGWRVSGDVSVAESAEGLLLENYRKMKTAKSFADIFLDKMVSACYVNIRDHTQVIYRRNEDEYIHNKYGKFNDYLEAVNRYISDDVYPEDCEMMFDAVDPDNIRAQLKRTDNYSVVFRDISQGFPRYFRLQIIKGEDDDHVAFGFINIDDACRQQNERIELETRERAGAAELKRQLSFVQALAAEYSSVYYVNLSDNILHPYVMNYVVKKRWGDYLASGISLEAGLGRIVLEDVYEDDRERVMDALKPENIRKALSKCKRTMIVFRRYILSGSLHYCRMKIAKVDDADKEPTAIAIGFAEDNEELISHFVGERIVAEYAAVYFMDLQSEVIYPLKEGEVTQYGTLTEADYEPAMKAFVARVGYGHDKLEKIIKPQGLIDFMGDMSVREVLYEMVGSEQTWRRAVFITFDRDKDGRAASVIAAYRPLDSLSSREMKLNEYIQKKLSDEYSNYCCVDMETGKIVSRSLDADGIRFIRESGLEDDPYQGVIENYINDYVAADEQQRVREACMPENVRKKLASGDGFSVYFRSSITGTMRYRRMRFAKLDDFPDKNYFILAFADADERVRASMEHSRAMAASRAKSTFLFNMSHDIRTPMNAIIGFTQMAMKHIEDKDKVADCLEKVSLSSEHLLQLINDVLDMARIESGKVTIEESATSVMAYADNVMSMMRATAEAKNITFEHEYRNIVDQSVYADILHVNQIVINLLSNAIKYTKPGGRVTYTIEQLPPRKEGHISYRFIIADTGIGMSEEFLEHVFEHFSRERSSTVSGIQGTGLGMSIVKKLVDLMHGTIEIKSTVGVGTRVTVEFDFRAVSRAASGLIAPVSLAPKSDSLAGMKVLLVEDNELNREIAREILVDFEIEVDEADDGAKAVNMLKEAEPGQYDLVLMDIQMPVMDGYEATTEIRRFKNSWVANIPIIAMTANVFDEDKKRAREVGMNGHLAKPIDVAEMVKLLQLFKR